MDSAGRARLKRIDAYGKSLRRHHDGKKELVLGNFPPAIAYRLKGERKNSTQAKSTQSKVTGTAKKSSSRRPRRERKSA